MATTGFNEAEIEELMTQYYAPANIDELLQEVDMSKAIDKPLWVVMRTDAAHQEAVEGALATLEASGVKVERIYAEENAIDMFPEAKLSPEELKARAKVESAIDKACRALTEVADIENENPGITASAIAERLDITKEKLDMMTQAVTKIRRGLEAKRVVAAC